jgi:hypothetical protein
MKNTHFFHLERENNPHRKEAFTADFLGKICPVTSLELNVGTEYLTNLLEESLGTQPVVGDVLIIGLTESGVIPSILMQKNASRKGITNTLLSSTRRFSSGIVFTERHSHGPDHSIPIPQQNVTEVWLVEDEITTGLTIYEILSRFCYKLGIQRVRVFAFTDFRNKTQREELKSAALDLNIDCLFHSFLSSNNANTTTKRTVKFSCNVKTNLHFPKASMRDIESKAEAWHMPDMRSALKQQQNKTVGQLSRQFEKTCQYCNVLVVGEAIDIATYLALDNPRIAFQHITLSPWKIDGSSIVSKVTFDNKFYLYNHENLNRNIFIINDPIDQLITSTIEKQLRGLGFIVKSFPLTDYHWANATSSTTNKRVSSVAQKP